MKILTPCGPGLGPALCLSRGTAIIRDLLERVKEAGCIIRNRFHIYCPGCGGTRALEALLSLRVRESLRYNPLVVLILLDLLTMLILRFLERRPNARKHYTARIVVHSLLLSAIVIVFLYRNYMLLFRGVDLLGDLSG